jgi:hypothetical protein
MTVVNGVTFPVGPWLPDVNMLSDIGEDIRTIALAALTLFGFADRYERTVLGTGAVPVEPSKANQLTVAGIDHYLGKAGQKQFLFHENAPGKYAFETAEYEIEITHPYPKRQGAQALRIADIAVYRAGLFRDYYIVWGAMKGVALKGVIPPAGGALWQAMDKSNGFMVGESTLKPPKGGEASISLKVAVQL